jgi:hypothetical protein
MYPGWNQNFMTYGGGYQATPLAQTFQEPVPKPPLRVKLTPRERGSYNIFISQADPDGHNRVEGPQAVEFFKRSGLPTDVLKTIWTIATPEGESYLDRERFYVAMRLIALAQEGKPVSEQSIYDDVQAGIPKFQSNVVVKDKWEVDSSDREKYLRSFKTLSGGKGFLDTNEAINAFRETGVKSDYLKKIWNLSDPEDSGEFRENQFIVAMHLASRVKTLSEPVPDELPASLKKVMSMKPNEPAKVLQPEPVDSLQEAFSIQQLTKYPNLPPAPAAFPGSSASGIPGFSSQFQTMPTIKINLDDGKNSMSSMSSMSSMNSMNNLKGKQEEKKEEDELLLAEPAPKAGLIESPPEKSEKNWASERKSLERKSIEGKVEIGSRKDEELSEQIERIEEKIQKKFREWRDIRAKLSLEREKGQMLQTKLQESNTKYLKELSQTILSILDE